MTNNYPQSPVPLYYLNLKALFINSNLISVNMKVREYYKKQRNRKQLCSDKTKGKPAKTTRNQYKTKVSNSPRSAQSNSTTLSSNNSSAAQYEPNERHPTEEVQLIDAIYNLVFMYEFSSQTAALAICYFRLIYRNISLEPVIQAVVAFVLAAKFNEESAPGLEGLIKLVKLEITKDDLIAYEAQVIKHLNYRLVHTTIIDNFDESTQYLRLSKQEKEFAISIIEFCNHILTFLNMNETAVIELTLAMMNIFFDRPCKVTEAIKNALKVISLTERFEFGAFLSLRRKSDTLGFLSLCSTAFDLDSLRRKLESFIV